MNRTAATSLRSATSVALVACTLATASCSGSGSGDETITVNLATDEDCYGVEVEVDESGLSAADRGTPASCVAAPGLLALGCAADADVTTSAYQLHASGCFAPDRTPLFQCTVTKALAQRFRDHAVVRCGCGCADTCPAITAASVCDGSGGHCDAAPASRAAGPASRASTAGEVTKTPGLAQATSVSSTTTYCGTCCDAQDIDTGVKIFDDSVVREIRFELAMPIGEPRCPDIHGCTADPAFDGPSRIGIGGDTIQVCLSSKDGVAGPHHLVSCSLDSDGTDEFDISGVSALDDGLRPVVPPPVLQNDFGVP